MVPQLLAPLVIRVKTFTKSFVVGRVHQSFGSAGSLIRILAACGYDSGHGEIQSNGSCREVQKHFGRRTWEFERVARIKCITSIFYSSVDLN